MQSRTLAVSILAMSLAGITTSASAAPIALGVRSGTLGLFGAEATLGLGSYVNLRVPFNTLDFDYNGKEDGVDYKGKLKLKNFGGQIDLHPFAGSFYLTAGVFANSNKLDLRAADPTGTEEYKIGDSDRVYTSDTSDPLTINGRVKFGSTAPYVGLGWGNPIQGASAFYFRFELGVLFQGSAEVGLGATGSVVDQESGQSFSTEGNAVPAQFFKAELEQERSRLEGDISDAIKIYPSIGLALGFRFGAAPSTAD